MAVNVLGTWHVLLAAEAAGVSRSVYFSSGQVFGLAEGERLPDYFPVDDAHPRRAMRPYGLSKCLAEDLCAGFTARTGIPTVSLRPVWVWDPGMYQRIEAQWRADPASEWTPAWEYGAFVDVRDVADACGQALTVPLAGHHRVLLCAPTSRPPGRASSWPRGSPRGAGPRTARFSGNPAAPCSTAPPRHASSGWQPRYGWSERSGDQPG